MAAWRSPWQRHCVHSTLHGIMSRLKILLLGPAGSGKTTIANLLADMSENLGKTYRPTEGVRIVEFYSQMSDVGNAHPKAEIELWDCGGGCLRLEYCWPALQNEVHGIVFVYNPSETSHVPELERLYHGFVTQTGLNPTNCMLFAHHKKAADRVTKDNDRLGNTFSRVLHAQGNVKENGGTLLSDFSHFFATVFTGLRDHNEQEELNIMNMQNL